MGNRNRKKRRETVGSNRRLVIGSTLSMFTQWHYDPGCCWARVTVDGLAPLQKASMACENLLNASFCQ